MTILAESPDVAAQARVAQSAVEASLWVFEALAPDKRASLKDMFCEYLDADDADLRKEIAISIHEFLAPPGYFDVGKSTTLDEWAASDSETEAAVQRLTKRKQQFAKRLRTIMDKGGLTQTELAKRLNVTQPSVASLLRGEHKPQPRTLKKLADALSVAVDDLWPTS